jgi:hypothetical protein
MLCVQYWRICVVASYVLGKGKYCMHVCCEVVHKWALDSGLGQPTQVYSAPATHYTQLICRSITTSTWAKAGQANAGDPTSCHARRWAHALYVCSVRMWSGKCAHFWGMKPCNRPESTRYAPMGWEQKTVISELTTFRWFQEIWPFLFLSQNDPNNP